MERVIVTDPDEYRSVAETAPDGARVPVEIRTTVDDPFLAYRRARDSDGCVYLATTGGQSGWGTLASNPSSGS